MSLLLFFVPIDPNFASVFFRRNKLLLLVEFIEQLLLLNVVLFLKRTLFNLQCIRSPLRLGQFILLFVKLAFICLYKFITLVVCLLE